MLVLAPPEHAALTTAADDLAPLRQDLVARLAGLEAAWPSSAASSAVVVEPNLTPRSPRPIAYTPGLNRIFLEYAQPAAANANYFGMETTCYHL